MSIFTITPGLIETTSFITQVERTIVSSSLGVTGSVHLSARPTHFLKTLTSNMDGFNDVNVQSENDYLFLASDAYKAAVNTGDSTNITQYMQAYMDLVFSSSEIPRNSIEFTPVRFTQPATISSDTTDLDANERQYFMKRVIKNNMMPNKRTEYKSADFSYGNYHCLNFFSNSNVSSQTAIIYANTDVIGGTRVYSPTGPFTLDFHIKPKNQTSSNFEYTAGTIFHISSSICVSLVTGSSKAADNTIDGFRVLLQLSQSADTNPSKVNLSSPATTFPNNLIFVSDDNSLSLNKWHHVTIRWGGDNVDNGTGSIKIDNVTTNFAVPSSSITTLLNSYALVLGNYFDGTSNNALFFNTPISTEEGIPNVIASTATPTSFGFINPLQAELHHVSWYDQFIIDSNIINASSLIDMSSSIAPIFFVGPIFNPDTTSLTTLKHPGITFVTSTDSPISYENALGVNGYYLNLQNFVKDYATVTQPRLFNLTGTMLMYLFE